MLFNTYVFIFAFLPAVLFVFYALRNQSYYSLAYGWLVIASLFFYGWWNPKYLLLIGTSIIFNFIAGKLLAIQVENKHTRHATLTLFIGITGNLLLLGYFKYANFFLDNFNQIAQTHWHLEKVVLPIAISFFTFQQIAFLVDTKRQLTKKCSFMHYCLFVCFFPQLIAGPIVHHKQVLPQFLQTTKRLNWQENLAIGGTLFFMGLFKKVVFADNLALVASPIFAEAELGHSINLFDAWIATIAYSLQLYFDFSGYSDMAIGLARMFGIRLPENFNSPYKANSIIDFWRRWHITLSNFLRDYLYIALGGNRNGSIRRYLNIGITMLLGGLWHGAGWNFIFWGGLHGLFLVVNHLWRGIRPRRGNTLIGLFFSRLLTLLAVSIAWVFFRAESMQGATAILKGMTTIPPNLASRFNLDSHLDTLNLSVGGNPFYQSELPSLALWAIFWAAIVWLLPNSQQVMNLANLSTIDEQASRSVTTNNKKLKNIWVPSPMWAVASAIIASAAILSLNQVSEFLYFNF